MNVVLLITAFYLVSPSLPNTNFSVLPKPAYAATLQEESSAGQRKNALAAALQVLTLPPVEGSQMDAYRAALPNINSQFSLALEEQTSSLAERGDMPIYYPISFTSENSNSVLKQDYRKILLYQILGGREKGFDELSSLTSWLGTNPSIPGLASDCRARAEFLAGILYSMGIDAEVVFFTPLLTPTPSVPPNAHAVVTVNSLEDTYLLDPAYGKSFLSPSEYVSSDHFSEVINTLTTEQTGSITSVAFYRSVREADLKSQVRELFNAGKTKEGTELLLAILRQESAGMLGSQVPSIDDAFQLLNPIYLSYSR